MSAADLRTSLRDGGVESWLVEAIARIARNADRSLDPYLLTVGEAKTLDRTSATCRCHFVLVDPQGTPRVPALTRMLSEQVVDYCIPRRRIEAAIQRMGETKSTDRLLQLQREARELFTTVANSGEGGELLLYALLEVALGLPQILCKMSLKTNAQVHYHGVDGVHAQALPDGKLAVYWGEAKLYTDVNAGIDAAMKSLAPFLLDDGTAQRDVLLLREHADTGDPELTAALVRYFTDDTAEASQLVVRGACLVGFSLDDYAHPLDGESVRTEVADAMTKWHDRVGAAIGNQKLDGFELEVFLVPLPSVQDFRDQLRKSLGLTP